MDQAALQDQAAAQTRVRRRNIVRGYKKSDAKEQHGLNAISLSLLIGERAGKANQLKRKWNATTERGKVQATA